MFEKANKEDLVFGDYLKNFKKKTVFRVVQTDFNNQRYVMVTPLKLEEFISGPEMRQQWLNTPTTLSGCSDDGEMVLMINEIIYNEGSDFMNFIFYEFIFKDQVRRIARKCNNELDEELTKERVTKLMVDKIGDDTYRTFIKRVQELGG